MPGDLRSDMFLRLSCQLGGQLLELRSVSGDDLSRQGFEPFDIVCLCCRRIGQRIYSMMNVFTWIYFLVCQARQRH